VVPVRIDLAPFRVARQDGLERTQVFTLPAGPTPLGAGTDLHDVATVVAEVAGGPRGVRVGITANLDLRCPCARCLDDVPVALEVRYAEEWRLQGVRPAAGDPAGGADEDGWTVRRAIPRDDHLVEIDDGFWQNVALELPVKVLCAEGCRGLCPRCGANRNRSNCACRDEAVDPRLAALTDWRPESTR
jgi:uncharacterized protein